MPSWNTTTLCNPANLATYMKHAHTMEKKDHCRGCHRGSSSSLLHKPATPTSPSTTSRNRRRNPCQPMPNSRPLGLLLVLYIQKGISLSALVPFDCLHETNTTHTASGEWPIADPAKSSQTTIVLKAR
jgi:hypothetical protein